VVDTIHYIVTDRESGQWGSNHSQGSKLRGARGSQKSCRAPRFFLSEARLARKKWVAETNSPVKCNVILHTSVGVNSVNGTQDC
jgi:hypothetical protein